MLMEKNPINSDGTAKAAETIKIIIQKQDIAETDGSIACLKGLAINAVFQEEEFPEGTFRVATLYVGGMREYIAAENYYMHEHGYQNWSPAIGIHHVPVYWDDQGGPGFAFGKSWTPGAREAIEAITAKAREEFALWINSDKADINIVAKA